MIKPPWLLTLPTLGKGLKVAIDLRLLVGGGGDFGHFVRGRMYWAWKRVRNDKAFRVESMVEVSQVKSKNTLRSRP
jgi:hypothetical protein